MIEANGKTVRTPPGMFRVRQLVTIRISDGNQEAPTTQTDCTARTESA